MHSGVRHCAQTSRAVLRAVQLTFTPRPAAFALRRCVARLSLQGSLRAAGHLTPTTAFQISRAAASLLPSHTHCVTAVASHTPPAGTQAYFSSS